MNISKNIAAFTAIALVAGNIPFIKSTPVCVNAGETPQKNITIISQNKETEGISALQYQQADGTWADIQENAYYSGKVQFRFIVDTAKIEIQNAEVTLLADGKTGSVIAFQSEDNAKVLEHGHYREYYFQLKKDSLTDMHTLEVRLDINKPVDMNKPVSEEEKKEGDGKSTETDTETAPYIQISFPKIYIETRIPELVLTSEYRSDTWTCEDVIVSLENTQKKQKVQTIYYVKKPGKTEYEKIMDTELEPVQGENDNKQYLYHIKDSGKGTYYFKAAYDLADSEQSNLSEEQNIDVQIDKVLPRIKVHQSKEGWTSKEVVFTLSNLVKNNSDITYYVKHNDGEWEQINTSQYTVSAEGKEEQYRFKAVSAVGEESSIYQNAEQKCWISEAYKVYIDKQNPIENKVNIVRKSGDAGNGEWYSKVPDITLDVKQDEGSKVSGYYKLYQEGTEKNYKLYEEGSHIDIQEDGTYIFETYAEDEALNQSGITKKKMNIDTTKPEITNIQFTDLDGNQLEVKDIAGYPFITNQKVLVTIEAEDALSGVDRIVYKSMESSQIKETSKQGNKVQFTISPRFIGKISAYAVDKMGNTSNVTVTDGLIEEITKPVITIDSSVDLSKWQKKDFSCNIGVQDNDSGIEKIIYEVNGNVIKETDYRKEKTLKKSNQQTIMFSEESKDSNGDTLKVTAIDRAGNQRVITKKVYLDKTAPKVTVSGIRQKGYFNKDQKLDIAVEESIYQYAAIDINIERYVDGSKAAYPVQEFQMNGKNDLKSLTFGQDGTYVVTIQAADKAGNRSEVVKKEFVIDKTAPVIQLSGVTHTYYADDVQLNVAVQESNYENNQVSIQVIREYNGSTTKQTLSDWNSTGKSTSSLKKFTLDGNYTIKVSSTDKAGNRAEEKTVKFIIDQTAPDIVVEGITPYEITKEAVNLKGLITENNIMPKGTKLEISREDLNGKTEIITSEYLDTPEKESTYAASITEEGKYHAVILSTDKAKNTTKKELYFIIDKTAPDISDLENFNGKYLQSFTWDKDKNDVIKDLTAVESHIFLNGIEYDGSFSAEEDGKYVLEISAEDELHQKSKKSAEFIVDGTAPVIQAVMQNEDNETIALDDKNTVYQTGRVEISLSDKEDWITKLKVNGKEAFIEEKTNQYHIPVEEKGSYHIQVEAVDLAGNINSFTTKIECTSRTEKVLKIVGAAGGVAVLAGVAGGVVYVRRKKHQ